MPVCITACSAAAVETAKVKPRLSALHPGKKKDYADKLQREVACHTCFPFSAWLRSANMMVPYFYSMSHCNYACVFPLGNMVQMSVWSKNLKNQFGNQKSRYFQCFLFFDMLKGLVHLKIYTVILFITFNQRVAYFYYLWKCETIN